MHVWLRRVVTPFPPLRGPWSLGVRPRRNHTCIYPLFFGLINSRIASKTAFFGSIMTILEGAVKMIEITDEMLGVCKSAHRIKIEATTHFSDLPEALGDQLKEMDACYANQSIFCDIVFLGRGEDAALSFSFEVFDEAGRRLVRIKTSKFQKIAAFHRESFQIFSGDDSASCDTDVSVDAGDGMNDEDDTSFAD